MNAIIAVPVNRTDKQNKGVCFDSAYDAAQYFGATTSTIINAVKNGKAFRNYYFDYDFEGKK